MVVASSSYAPLNVLQDEKPETVPSAVNSIVGTRCAKSAVGPSSTRSHAPRMPPPPAAGVGAGVAAHRATPSATSKPSAAARIDIPLTTGQTTGCGSPVPEAALDPQRPEIR